METLGCFFALASAFSWALSAILFRKLGEEAHPLGMNLVKCIIGLLYLWVMTLLIKKEQITLHDNIFLAVSGLLGITIGDSLFFKALVGLGPRLTLLIETLSPAVTVAFAVMLLHERIYFVPIIGIIITISSVAWVAWRSCNSGEIRVNPSGFKYAILFVLCNSMGIILAKIGLVSISALQATFIRFFWGTIGLILWGGLTRQLNGWLTPFRKNYRLLRFILLAVFVATFGGFWLSLLAIKYTYVSIATILNSMAPVFILPMAAFMLKEKLTIQKIVGASAAIFGVILIFIR